MDDVTRDMRLASDDASPPPPGKRRKRIIGLLLGLVVVAGLATIGTLYWLDARHYESTDDAMVDANTTQVAPRVAGQVTRLLFADNQHVAAGQPLLQIDPSDNQAKLDQARAQQANAEATLEQAQAQLAVQQANVDQTVANVRIAEADLQQAQLDYDRFRKIAPGAVTRQQVEASTATFQTAQAKLDASRQTVQGARAQVRAATAQVQAAEASIKHAEATVRQAELQVSWCTVTAPVAGIVTHRTVDAGNYVNPGQPMFALVQDDRWITANFKETQLRDMHPGQDVEISIDALSSVTLHGKVDSFQAGTGTAFSVLPAENATGNYVKIVQRVPVKIVFDDSRLKDRFIAPGMSAVPTVKVR